LGHRITLVTDSAMKTRDIEGVSAMSWQMTRRKSGQAI
jgi:hypothetical protein